MNILCLLLSVDSLLYNSQMCKLFLFPPPHECLVPRNHHVTQNVPPRWFGNGNSLSLSNVDVELKIEPHGSPFLCSPRKNPPNRFTYLSKIDGQVDFVVLHTAGQGRRLPPLLRSVDGILWRMVSGWIRGIAHVADLQRRSRRSHYKEYLRIAIHFP